MRVAWLLATAACTAAYRAPFPRPRAPRASSVRLCEEPAEPPLPAGWKQAKAPDGRTYYYLPGGKGTQWVRPTEPDAPAPLLSGDATPPATQHSLKRKAEAVTAAKAVKQAEEKASLERRARAGRLTQLEKQARKKDATEQKAARVETARLSWERHEKAEGEWKAEQEAARVEAARVSLERHEKAKSERKAEAEKAATRAKADKYAWSISAEKFEAEEATRRYNTEQAWITAGYDCERLEREEAAREEQYKAHAAELQVLARAGRFQEMRLRFEQLIREMPSASSDAVRRMQDAAGPVVDDIVAMVEAAAAPGPAAPVAATVTVTALDADAAAATAGATTDAEGLLRSLLTVKVTPIHLLLPTAGTVTEPSSSSAQAAALAALYTRLDRRTRVEALLRDMQDRRAAAEFGRTEQRLRGLLATPGAAPDEIFQCTQQLLTDTHGTLVARCLGLVGSDSALPAYAGDGFPRELAERRHELLLAVVDHACARVAAHDGEAPISHGRLMSLVALRQLLLSPELPKYALRHGLGRLRHSESEANLKDIYESLNFPYTPRLVNGHPFPPSASDIFLQQPSPLYAHLMEQLNPLSIANLSRLEAATRMLLVDFQPSSIASGTERRRSGSVIVGMEQARQLRDAEYAAYLDMEYMTPEKGWLNLITGGGKRWHDANLRLVRLATKETVHSLSRKKPKDEGLDAGDIEPFERRVKKYMKAGYKIYSFFKPADSQFITHCAGLEPHEYDRVAVDFRALLGSLTTFFLDTGAPNSMDIARDAMGLPGTAEWELAGRARIEGLLHTAGAGVPHTAPMDTWQLAFPGCMVHKLLNDRSLPISQLLAAP